MCLVVYGILPGVYPTNIGDMNVNFSLGNLTKLLNMANLWMILAVEHDDVL